MYIRLEIKSALMDRDHAMKVVNEMKQASNHDGKADTGHSELRCEHQESYDKLLSVSEESKQLLNKETEGLKKEVEKLQGELAGK